MRDWIGVLGHVRVVDVPDQDPPAPGLEEAAEQVDDGALAAAGRPHQRDGLALLHQQVEVAQDRLALLVVELHVVEDDVAPERAVVRRARLVHHIRHRIHEREDALARGDGLLHLGEDARHLLHRPDDEEDVGDEGIEAAYREPGHVHGDAGVCDHAGGGQRRDQLHGGQEERREPRGPVAGPVHLARQLAELLQVGLFPIQRLDDAHTGDRLVVRAGDLRVDLPHVAVLDDDLALEERGHHDDDGHDQHDHQRQRRADQPHEVERGQNVKGRPGHVQQTPGHQFGHPIGVRRDAADDPAHGRAVVVGQRQALQVAEQPLAQVVADALAQDASQVDEAEDEASLQHRQRCVLDHDLRQHLDVPRRDALVDDAHAQVGEVGVQPGHRHHREQEARHP